MALSSILLIVSFVLMLLGFGTFVYHIYFGRIFFNKNEPKTSENASAFGGFISGITGPVFALAGFLIVYSTIIENRQDSNENKFESIFFKLLDYQRENLISLTLDHPTKCDEVSGYEVWGPLRSNMISSKKFLDSSKYTKDNLTDSDRQKLFYILFFYGIPSNSQFKTSRSLPVLKKFIKDTVALDSFLHQSKRLKHCEKNSRRFIGYSNKLTPIFNQFYNCITYIDQCDYITDRAKKQYVKIVVDQHPPFCLALMSFHFSSELETQDKMQLLEKYDVFLDVDRKLIELPN